MTTYARKCDITGEGMNEGFVYRDGYLDGKYFKYQADFIAFIKTERPEFVGRTDLDIINTVYNEDELYWTEWPECDHQFEMVGNKLIEI